MTLHVEFKNFDAVHTRLALFVNGAKVGEFTMRNAAAIGSTVFYSPARKHSAATKRGNSVMKAAGRLAYGTGARGPRCQIMCRKIGL
jgi:hypothetical protein